MLTVGGGMPSFQVIYNSRYYTPTLAQKSNLEVLTTAAALLELILKQI